jgi:hypothetical protein
VDEAEEVAAGVRSKNSLMNKLMSLISGLSCSLFRLRKAINLLTSRSYKWQEAVMIISEVFWNLQLRQLLAHLAFGLGIVGSIINQECRPAH